MAQPPKKSWLSRLSRVTTSGRFIPEIDGFRFIAIGSVVIAHSAFQVLLKNGLAGASTEDHAAPLIGEFDSALNTFLACGVIGVQFFFVISGFVLALPFAEHYLFGKKKPALRDYFLRRVTRLEPPYLINMALFAGLILLYKPVTLGQTFWHFLASIFYIHNQVYQEGSIINNVAWSLEVEIQFYLIVPLLAWLFAIRDTRLRRWVLAGLVLGFGILNNAAAPADFRYVASLPSAIQYFFAGFLLADIYLASPAILRRGTLLWDALAALAIAIICASLIIGGGRWGSLTFYLPFAILLVYIAGFKGPLLNRLFRSAPIFLIGGMCYTIYLYHGHLLSLLSFATRPLYFHSLPFWINYPFQFAIHGSIILAICILLFILIERPCMKKDWPQRLWRRLSGKNPSLKNAPQPAPATAPEAWTDPVTSTK